MIEIGRAPEQLTLSPDGARAYIVDYDHIAVGATVLRGAQRGR